MINGKMVLNLATCIILEHCHYSYTLIACIKKTFLAHYFSIFLGGGGLSEFIWEKPPPPSLIYPLLMCANIIKSILIENNNNK